jgi:hypothetical protein
MYLTCASTTVFSHFLVFEHKYMLFNNKLSIPEHTSSMGKTTAFESNISTSLLAHIESVSCSNIEEYILGSDLFLSSDHRILWLLVNGPS